MSSSKRGASPIAQAVDLVLQALDGVDAVHRLGIVHRDLKPDNLFLARTKARGRTLKILDFGFAKVLGESTGSTYIAPLAISTSEREFVGAPRYVSPEQLLAGKHVDYRADIYTLGLILYLLVLGREPHHDVDSQSELLRAQLEGHLDPPSTETAKRVPDELMAIIWRATAMDPTGRFWSANEFAAELRQFVDQQRPAARTPTLSIQQHAELTAAIEVEPTRVDELRARYGVISRAQVQAVEAWWKQNVANDPKVHAKWRALVDLWHGAQGHSTARVGRHGSRVRSRRDFGRGAIRHEGRPSRAVAPGGHASERMRQEAKPQERLNHKNIVRVYSAGATSAIISKLIRAWRASRPANFEISVAHGHFPPATKT